MKRIDIFLLTAFWGFMACDSHGMEQGNSEQELRKQLLYQQSTEGSIQTVDHEVGVWIRAIRIASSTSENSQRREYFALVASEREKVLVKLGQEWRNKKMQHSFGSQDRVVKIITQKNQLKKQPKNGWRKVKVFNHTSMPVAKISNVPMPKVQVSSGSYDPLSLTWVI